MLKHYFLSFTFLLISIVAFAQGTESFTNIPTTTTPSSYITRTWTGDNGRTWTATAARTDSPSDPSIVGMNGKFIIFRDTGKIICEGIPNGCGTVSFDYTKAFSGSPVIALYVNGSKYGGDLVVPAGSTSKANIVVNVTGAFKFEIRQSTIGTSTRVAIDSVKWTSFNAVPCPEPATQPTNLALSSTPTSITGTFTVVPPATSIENYLVVRTTSPTLTADPVDGVSYTAGQVVNSGNGIVVEVSDDGSFINTGLTPNTAYSYFIFSMEDQSCGGGPNYLQTNPLTASASTPALPACSTPANPPTGLTLTPNNTTITGSFTASATANRYLVVISQNATLSATPVDGTIYNTGEPFGGGNVVVFSSNTSFTATGLTVATPYYIFVFAANAECTGSPVYNSSSLSGMTTTTNNTTGIPVGYYDAANGLTCQPLKTALKNIITNGANVLTYTPGLWNLYQFSDLRRNDDNTADIIWDMYSDNPTGPDPYTFTYGVNQCGNYTGEGECYNREHSTPQSWFTSSSPMVSDAHHVFPTDGKVNAIRSNFPYGEVITASTTSLNGSKLGTGNNFNYTGTVFEPINEYKGDFARAGLYMAVRYEDQIIANNWSNNGSANSCLLSLTDQPDAAERRLRIYDEWELRTFLKWATNDPVSQKEIDRNNAIYYQEVSTGSGAPIAQRNRNPFVDHPEYLTQMFQCTGLLPVTLIDFNAKENTENVLVTWTSTFETNFRNYEVERSVNGVTFTTIGTVAGQNLGNYHFYDNHLPAENIIYYRLKMVDIDGKTNYSKIVSVRLTSAGNRLSLFPNPTANFITVKLTQVATATTNVKITDITGRAVKTKSIAAGTVQFKLDVSDLPSGRYFIQVISNASIINESFSVIR